MNRSKRRIRSSEIVCLNTLFILTVQELAFVITGSTGQIKAKYVPLQWSNLSEELSGQNIDVKSIWERLKKISPQVSKESDLYQPFSEILELGGCSNIWQDDNDHQSTDTVPDFVLFRGHKWNPKEGALRANVVVDIEIKQRFNPIGLTPAANYRNGFPGDAGDAYVQALKRAAAAFRVNSKLNYFVVVTDMENVIFWKLVPTEDLSIKAYGSGPHLFGGKYSGRRLINVH
jgi:hypothetical protein